MDFNLFGYQVGNNKKPTKLPKNKVTYTEPTDGSRDIVSHSPGGGHFVHLFEGNILPKKEIELIKKYRQVAMYTEVDKAVSEIVNDAVTYDDVETYPVKLSLDDVKGISDGTKGKIQDEFDYLLSVMEFDQNGYDYFRYWYVDGRIFFNIVMKDKEKEGIEEIVHVDSLFIKKVREIEKDPNDGTIKSIEEYFLHAPEYAFGDVGNVTIGTKNVVKFTTDSVIFVTSGMYCKEDKLVQSHLHKAIKPANQLNMIEDAIVIYRVTRAPERRIFYIDVGNLPKNAAEQYLTGIMNQYRNKVVYNTSTGEINDQKNAMAMLEDFWLPRREGGKGTEISTLAGGENLGQLEDIIYFRKKLYDSLNVPNGRMESESLFTLAKDSEITREEVKFAKFVDRLRKRFAKGVFIPLLKVQCIAKNIVSENDWEDLERQIKFKWVEDSHFAELKKIQVLNDRVEVAINMSELVGTYFSKEYVRKNVFNQTDEEISVLKKQREDEEKNDPTYDENGLPLPGQVDYDPNGVAMGLDGEGGDGFGGDAPPSKQDVTTKNKDKGVGKGDPGSPHTSNDKSTSIKGA